MQSDGKLPALSSGTRIQVPPEHSSKRLSAQQWKWLPLFLEERKSTHYKVTFPSSLLPWVVLRTAGSGNTTFELAAFTGEVTWVSPDQFGVSPQLCSETGKNKREGVGVQPADGLQWMLQANMKLGWLLSLIQLSNCWNCLWYSAAPQLRTAGTNKTSVWRRTGGAINSNFLVAKWHFLQIKEKKITWEV